MSIVKYNGITLPYAQSTDFRQEAVYDESGTDRIYTKFDIKVRCLVGADYLRMLAPSLVAAGEPVTDNAAVIMKAVRNRLLRPRQQLSFTFNGVDLIPLPQNDLTGTVDAKNGPNPMMCEIVPLQNVLFILTFHVVAHYWENNQINPLEEDPSDIVDNRRGGNVLTNRWTETVEIDECNYTKRTRDGKFIIRSDNFAGAIADVFRSQFAVVSVPAGFLRTVAKYTQSPDGLAIQYHVEDTEVYVNPPPPAFVAEGDYTFNSAKKGAHVWHEVQIRLKGDKETNKAQMLTSAVGVCVKKLKTVGADLAVGQALLDASQINVNLYKNEVEVRMRTMAVPAPDSGGKGRLRGIWGVPAPQLTFTPDSNIVDLQTPLYLDRGTANYLLRAAAYFDPSLTNVGLGQKPISTDDNPVTPTENARVQNIPGNEIGTLGRNNELLRE